MRKEIKCRHTCEHYHWNSAITVKVKVHAYVKRPVCKEEHFIQIKQSALK